MPIPDASGLQSLNLLQAEAALASHPPTSPAANAGPKAAAGSSAAEMQRWKTSLDFQTMFLTQLYKSMRQTVDHSDLTQPSFARNMFTDMFDQDVAAAPASSPLTSGLAGLTAAQNGTSNSLAAEIYRSLRQSGRTLTPTDIAGLKGAPTPAVPSSGGAALPPAQLNPLVQAASQQYDVPADLLRSVIHAESAGDPAAVSSKGAKGLMQLTDTTSAAMGVANPFDPLQNVMGGARYLRTLLDRYHGNEGLALAGYNAGPATVDRFGGIPPYPETQDYVSRVLQMRNHVAQGDSP